MVFSRITSDIKQALFSIHLSELSYIFLGLDQRPTFYPLLFQCHNCSESCFTFCGGFHRRSFHWEIILFVTTFLISVDEWTLTWALGAVYPVSPIKAVSIFLQWAKKASITPLPFHWNCAQALPLFLFAALFIFFGQSPLSIKHFYKL